MEFASHRLWWGGLKPWSRPQCQDGSLSFNTAWTEREQSCNYFTCFPHLARPQLRKPQAPAVFMVPGLPFAFASVGQPLCSCSPPSLTGDALGPGQATILSHCHLHLQNPGGSCHGALFDYHTGQWVFEHSVICVTISIIHFYTSRKVFSQYPFP